MNETAKYAEYAKKNTGLSDCLGVLGGSIC
jgi:hypothetical protein